MVQFRHITVRQRQQADTRSRAQGGGFFPGWKCGLEVAERKCHCGLMMEEEGGPKGWGGDSLEQCRVARRREERYWSVAERIWRQVRERAWRVLRSREWVIWFIILLGRGFRLMGLVVEGWAKW